MELTAHPPAFAEFISNVAVIARTAMKSVFILGIPKGLQLRVVEINVLNSNRTWCAFQV
jgi:hypothetical protein